MVQIIKRRFFLMLTVAILIASMLNIAKADTNSTQINAKASITSYGADSSLEDNSSAINKAILNNDNVTMPEGTFKIQSSIKLRNGTVLEGTRGASKIIIDDTFDKGRYFPNNEFAILNEHFDQVYNDTTADDITIKGITFIMTKDTVNSIQTILGLGNIKHLDIEDCDFICESNKISSNDIDLYAACKNVTVKNCNIKNLTDATSGCNIQVRNYTTQSAAEKEGNETSNVVIENNSFEKSSNDEAVVVYSVVGQVKDVSIRNNKIYSHGTKQTVVTAIYAGEFNNYSTAKIKDVTFEGNEINVDDFGSSVVQVGQSSDQVATIDNVIISSNTINANVSLTGVSTIVKIINQSSNTNINVKNNKINNIGNKDICYAITGASEVEGNNIKGNFSSSISKVGKAYNNQVDDNVSGAAIENTLNVDSNAIENCHVGIKCYTSETYYMKNNTISLGSDSDSTGIELLNVGNASPIAYAENNIINVTNSDKRAFYEGAGKFYLKDNNIYNN